MRSKMTFTRRISGQTGAVLITSLMLLVILMLMAVSAVNSNTVNLRIVHNVWSQTQAVSAAQQGLDTIFHTQNNFAANNTTWSQSINEHTVSIAKRECIRTEPLSGYSAASTSGVIPEETEWLVESEATDNLTGADVKVYEGVTVIMPAGNCI